MGGRGASAGDTNSRILSKIVSLENKRNGENTRQYLRDNNLSLMQDYENVQRTENITYRTLQGKDETYTETINERRKTTIGVYKGNTRIGTLEEKRGKFRIKKINKRLIEFESQYSIEEALEEGLYHVINEEYSNIFDDNDEISKHIPRID